MKGCGMCLIALFIGAIIVLAGCAPKEENMVFTAMIEEVYEGGLLVTTVDYDGFDRAHVGYGEGFELNFDPLVGQKLTITILPAIRESYPVQVTAVSIQLWEDAPASAPEYRKITPKEAKEMMDSGDVIILDVRSQPEFAEVHIADAILLPDSEIAALAHDVLPDQDATILVYCRSGKRSQAAAKALVELGYTGIYDFGGIMEWPYETVSGD